MTGTGGTRSPKDILRSLRLRLTAWFAVVAVVSIAAFGAAVVSIDASARSRELDQRLLGQASRAAALVYTAHGTVETDAVEDDVITEQAAFLVVYERTPGGSLRAAFVDRRGVPAGATAAARSALADGAERGSHRSTRGADGDLRLVALPWFDGAAVGGAVVVAAPRPSVLDSGLLVPSAVGGTALALVLVAVAALVLRRGLRPAEDAVDERDRFLAMAAHELRTPIARIKAGAEALGRTIRSDREQAAALRDLVAIADGAGRVVGDLLLAARIDHGDVPVRHEPVRLDILAAETEHIDPAVVVDVTAPVSVLGDADLLRHAVRNLVENALLHGRVPGRALVVTVQVQVTEQSVVIAVADDGHGIPAHLPVVEPFIRAGNGGGSGLGLALVAWIAAQHGAELRLAPNDPGTIASLRFPLSPPRAR